MCSILGTGHPVDIDKNVMPAFLNRIFNEFPKELIDLNGLNLLCYEGKFVLYNQGGEEAFFIEKKDF